MDATDGRRPRPRNRDRRRARLPEGIFELLLAHPWVRPGVVARSRALLASRALPPEPHEMARGVVDRLVAERVA